MVVNYLSIACRNLLGNKLFSLINVGGLSIGFASCVFIIYFICDELSFDRFHEKSDRIYRITTTFIDPPNTNKIRFTDQKIGLHLKRVHPHVEETFRLAEFNGKFQLENELVYEPNVFATDASIFDVFTYPLLAGNPKKVFEKKNSIVLSESLARKYFDQGAFGGTLTINNEQYEVTGIMKDVPANSDKWVNGLVFGDFPGEDLSRLELRFDTYVLFKSGFDISEFQSVLKKAAASIWSEALTKPATAYEMQNLRDLHFTHGIQMDNAKGNKDNIYIFLTIGFILLLVVIFNFINLTTVKSLERAKEVGVRKVVGATPFQLVRQFVGESLVTTIVSGLIALFLVVGFYSIFQFITGKTIYFSSQKDFFIIAGSIFLLILIIQACSLYPASLLSGFKPVTILNGRFSHRPTGLRVRKVFLTSQFGLTTSLLIFLMVVMTQMTRMRETDLGFNRNDILVLDMPSHLNANYLKNELLRTKGVLQVSSGEFLSLPGGSTGSIPIWFSQFGVEREIQVQSVEADIDYPELLQLKVLKGKFVSQFPESQWNDLVLVNETLAQEAGWDEPVGMQIETFAFGGRKKVTIAGIIRDFHFKSLHNTIDPMIYFAVPPGGNYLYVRLSVLNLEELRIAWQKLVPEYPMQFLFLNESFEKQYRAEEILTVLLLYFSWLTILLAGLGLYGLTAYNVELRTKEIGIRKVLGAGVSSIIWLLLTDFIKLIVVGALIGSIVAVHFSSNWLRNYAYKVEISWWQFTVPFVVIVLFSILVIGYRTYWHAQSNPTRSLKYE